MSKMLALCLVLWVFYAQAMETAQILITGEIAGDLLHEKSEEKIKQFIVADQAAMKGSDADCGYHALSNGFALARLAQSLTKEEQEIFLEWLRSEEKKNELFVTPESPWKSAVIEDRMRREAKKKVTYHLLKSLKNAQEVYEEPQATPLKKVVPGDACNTWLVLSCQNEGEVKKVEGVMSLVRNLSIQLIDESGLNAQKSSYVLSGKDAFTILETTLEAKSRPLGEWLMANSDDSDLRMHQTYQDIFADTLKKYIDITDTEITASLDDGTWLDAQEILRLSTLKSTFKKFNVGKKNNIPILTIGDSPEARFSMAQDAAVRFGGQFTDLIEQLKRDGDHLAIICMYEPLSSDSHASESFLWYDWIIKKIFGSSNTATRPIQSDQAYYSNASKVKGHWYTLLVNKVGQTVQFVLADSFRNEVRIKDKRVTEAINLLEGRMLPITENEGPAGQLAAPIESSGSHINDYSAGTAVGDSAQPSHQPKSFIERHSTLIWVAIGAAIIIIAIVAMARNWKNDTQKKDAPKKKPSIEAEDSKSISTPSEEPKKP